MVILDENEKELFNLVFKELINLPAYKLNKKYQNILRKYAYKEFNQFIKNKSLEDNYKINKDEDITNEYIYEIYQKQKPSLWKVFLFSFNSLSHRDKLIGCISIVFFALSFLVRANNYWLIGLGIFCFLLFNAFLISYGMLFNIWYFQVNSTFSFINSILKDIKESVIDFKYFNEPKLKNKAKVIARSILKDEQSKLNNFWRKAPIFHFLFASFICIMFVYVVGDTFLNETIWIANVLGFKDFKLIQELNLEQFTIVFLFPFGLLLSKFVVNSGCDKRRKEVARSLEQLKEPDNQ